jgi:SNF2 family DNA or RNA helicase
MQAAMVIKGLGDVQPWPPLKWFNTEPCARHAPRREPLCRRCGIEPRRHQRVGSAFLQLGMQELLSDTMGSGKTAQVLMVLAMCKETGELSLDNRCVIICRAAAIHDPWADELARLTPGLNVFVADGIPAERAAGYAGDWEVAVVSDRTFGPAEGSKRSRDGDVAWLTRYPVGILVYDDIDAMRNHRTRTYRAVMDLAGQCSRVIGVHATPLQKQLTELWCFLAPVGGQRRLGTLTRCRQRFVTRKGLWINVPDSSDPTGRRTRRRKIWIDNGITDDPDRIEEFREAIAPLVLRRTAADFDDVGLPLIQPDPVRLELLPEQQARYEELRQGVLRRLTTAGETITQAQAAAAFTYARQITSGLAAVDVGTASDVSVKLDWTMRALTGDLADEKVVCFVYFKPNVAALSRRLDAARIGHVLMWSDETDKRERHRRLTAFREDPATRVLVGTTTIEASLNLQIARHLIAVDAIWNPARMAQLIGRIAREGSPFGMVFLHLLLAVGTQDDGLLPLLRREQAVADVVWDEASPIEWSISPRRLMNLIARGQATEELSGRYRNPRHSRPAAPSVRA